MNRLLLFLALFFATALSAALPPLAQSSRELQALLSDSELHTLLKSGEPIQAVLRTNTGYVVMTKSSLLRVDVEYLSQAHPGPKQFRFHIYPPVELSSGETGEHR